MCVLWYRYSSVREAALAATRVKATRCGCRGQG
jgi:hypothetical protein